MTIKQGHDIFALCDAMGEGRMPHGRRQNGAEFRVLVTFGSVVIPSGVSTIVVKPRTYE